MKNNEKYSIFIIFTLFVVLFSLSLSFASEDTNYTIEEHTINDNMKTHDSNMELINLKYDPNTNEKINNYTKENKLEYQSKNKKSKTNNQIIYENKNIKSFIKTYNNTIIRNCNITNLTNFGNLTIINSNIKNVNSKLILLYNKGNLSLINVNITNCQAPKYILYGANITKIINCTFTGNKLTKSLNTCTIMLLRNTQIENTIYKNNEGGIKAANVTIKNCTFTGNKKLNITYTDHNGGAIITYGQSKIFNSNFKSNTLNTTKRIIGVGGAIYNTGNLTITNTTMTNNHANRGNTLFNKGTITITNCTITNNAKTWYGGAIHNHKGNITIKNTK